MSCGLIIVIIIIIVAIAGKHHYDQMKYSASMMRLWIDHVLYTRAAIVAVLSTGDDHKQLDILTTRLLKNQSDIGSLFTKQHGAEAGQELSGLLQLHVKAVIATLNAIKSRDQLAVSKAKAELYSNAANIGKFLDDKLGTGEKSQSHMKLHIDALLANIAAYSNSDYPADITTLDSYIESGTQMAIDIV